MLKLALILLATLVTAYALVWIVGSVLKRTKRNAVAIQVYGQSDIANVRVALRYVFRNRFTVSIDRGYRQFLRRLEVERKRVTVLEKWKPEWKHAPQILKGSFSHLVPQFVPYKVPAVRAGGDELLLTDFFEIRNTNAEKAGARLRRLANLRCEDPREMPIDWSFSVVDPPLVADEITTEDLRNAHYEVFAKGRVGKKIIESLFREEIAAVSVANSEIQHGLERAQELGERLANARRESASREEAFRRSAEESIQRRRKAYEDAMNVALQPCEQQKAEFRILLNGYEKKTQQGVTEYFDVIAKMINLPAAVPNEVAVGYDSETQILIVDVRLNNLLNLRFLTEPRLNAGVGQKQISRRESTQVAGELHPLHLLRIGQEIALADEDKLLSTIVLNGWVEYAEPSTGKTKRGYVASVIATPSQFLELVLATLDPVAAFRGLRGMSAFVVDDVVPIKPTITLNRHDPRFVEGREVLSLVGAETNLAAMDWEAFEHLIRQLFEKLFAGAGTEVHVTQASRDRGVDAVVLDPDPIRGGKTIIQAKRYANTVDVAAVRDLYGALMNEGASRGILVTTSNFGSDAYQFVKDKPLTLINGAGLLAYLKEIGFEARIDLEEAKRLNAQNI